MESTLAKVGKDSRILLSTALLKRAGWAPGDAPMKGWLIVGSPGRCRLVHSSDFESDSSCLSLRNAIDEETAREPGSLIEFRADSLVALAMRLLPIEVTPPGPGWRLAIPRELGAIMGILPNETSVALLLVDKHIEIWSLETLRSSTETPISELI
jgi:hypothetical protein